MSIVGPYEIKEEDVERALARPWYRVGLGAPLDDRFEAITLERRNGELHRQLGILGAINCACLMLDDTVGLLKPGLLLRLGLVLPLVMIAIRALRRSWPARWRGVATMAPLCALLVIAMGFGKALDGWASDRYIMAAGILMCGTNLVMVLRLPQALVLTGLNASLFVGIACWPAGRPVGQVADLILFFLVLVTLSVRAAHRIDRSNKNMVLYRLRSELQAKALVRANRELGRLSGLDHLTGIPNRRAMEAALLAGVRAARRAGGTVGLLLIDIDHFKSFNDTAGHLAGDRALQQVAAIIQGEVPAHKGTVARYGGEEFAVVLPHSQDREAVDIAERIRRAVEGRRLPHPGFGGAAVVTISVGAAALRTAGEKELIAAADRALYAAKAGGRNRVALADAPGPRTSTEGGHGPARGERRQGRAAR